MNFNIYYFYFFFFFFFFLGGGGGGRGHPSSKLNMLRYMKILWVFLGRHCKTGLFFELISMHFRLFS